MKERPILFSTEMVQSILEGRKTQTRRVVANDGCDLINKPNSILCSPSSNGVSHFRSIGGLTIFAGYKCPYGKVGDKLWVRETFSRIITPKGEKTFIYKADDDCYKDTIEDWQGWTPSIHMPKEAARIWLEITDIRVERLQDISEGDVKAEGVLPAKCCDSYYHGFSILWQSIKGEESWRQDPFVWVIKFKKIDKV